MLAHTQRRRLLAFAPASGAFMTLGAPFLILDDHLRLPGAADRCRVAGGRGIAVVLLPAGAAIAVSGDFPIVPRCFRLNRLVPVIAAALHGLRVILNNGHGFRPARLVRAAARPSGALLLVRPPGLGAVRFVTATTRGPAAAARCRSGPAAFLDVFRRRFAVQPFDLFAAQLFDGAHRFKIARRHQRRGKAFLAGASGTADAVNIILRRDRNVEIEDVADIGDIEAARRDVACRQQRDVAPAERIEGGGAVTLLHVAMQTARIVTMLQKRLQQDADIALAVAEDDRILDARAVDEITQNLALDLDIGGGEFQALNDCAGGRALRGDFDPLGIVEEFVGQLFDFFRHGRREEQRLARGGQRLADFFDIGDESHVEHAVGFVDDQDLDRRQEQPATSEMIQKPSGRGDQNVRASVQLAVLVLERHAADQQRDRELVIDAELLECLMHLRGKFASRLQNERPRHSRPGPARFEPRQHRKHERRRLAGAGLRDAHDVAALIGQRDGLRLNGCRLIETSGGDGVENFLTKTEICKCHIHRFAAASR